jgi:hypothetical protein
MAILVVFLLGIANFAAHKAVVESGHPLLGQLPFFHLLGGRFSMAIEFLMLLGAMLMAGSGSMSWGWLYGAYSVMNGLSAWLIVNGKV